MIVDALDISANVVEDCDAVVIGTGAGGAVVAKELAEQGKKVIVLEEGGRHTSEDFDARPFSMMARMYRAAGSTMTLGTPAVVLPLGKTVGGTTTINSGTCFRLPPKVFKRWNWEHGVYEHTAETMEPHFARVEKTANIVQGSYEVMSPGNLAFRDGVEALGYSGGALNRNVKNCRGSGVCPLGCPQDAKQGTNLSYVPLAIEHGAKIYTHCKAYDIVTAKGRAVGVKGKFRKQPGSRKQYKITVKADVVIVACGAIYSPVLLQRNRIANSSGQVGRNLRIHPATKILALFEREIRAQNGAPQAYYMDEFADEGLMFEGFWVPPSMLAVALPQFGMELKEVMALYNHMAGFGLMVSDTSRGRVMTTPRGTPLVTYNLNKADTRSFIRGTAIAAEVFFAAGADRVIPPIFGINELRSPADIHTLYEGKIRPGDFELAAFHPMGTCRMGADPKKSVVGPHCESHDVKNLFVVDASVFPTSLGVNPQQTIMAFATMVAEHLKTNEGRYFN